MSKLNASVERLAVALGDVFKAVAEDAVESVRDDVRKDTREEVQASEERLNTRIDRAVEDTVAQRQRAADA